MRLLVWEIRLVLRRFRNSILMLGFALIALTLLTISTDPTQLAPVAAGYVWTIILLSILLQLDSVWNKDAESGRLDLLLIQPYPLWILVLAKACGLWLRAGAPWLMIAPFFALMLQMPTDAIPPLLLSLLVGLPSLCLLTTVGGCLILGARQPTLLLMIIVMPLLLPTLIFAAMGVQQATIFPASLMWLGVCLGLSILCIPIGALALKQPPTT